MGTMLITGILIFNNGFGAHRLLGMLWVRFIRRLIFRIWNAHTLRECLVVLAWAFYEKYRHGIIGLVAAYYYILGIKNIFKPSWKQPSFAAAATALKHILSLGKSDLYGNALYVTWSVFSRHDIFESVDDDGDDRERERKGPTEQRVRDELLPLRAGAKPELSRRKLKIDQISFFIIIISHYLITCPDNLFIFYCLMWGQLPFPVMMVDTFLHLACLCYCTYSFAWGL